MGWGTVCSNDSNVPQIINHVERATTKMLDRWSVLTYDGPPIVSGSDMPTNDEAELNNYLDTILDNQNPEKVHKAVDGLYELSKKVQISRLSKFLDLIQKAGWTNNADVNQVRQNFKGGVESGRSTGVELNGPCMKRDRPRHSILSKINVQSDAQYRSLFSSTFLPSDRKFAEG